MNNNNHVHVPNPLQQGDELFLQIPPVTDNMDTLLSQCLDPPMNSSGRKSPLDSQGQKKKMVHREAERQRRQEMNSLYTSLRSQLPLEYVKGKRSMSDHMNEATNYIQHLEKNNQQLRHKRDKLKNLSNSSTSTADTVLEGTSVTVERCWPGIEVVIASGLKDESVVPLSGVLQVLCEERLSPVNCVSSTVNKRLIHTIQAKVQDEVARSDISRLQQKLMNTVKTAS